MLLSQQAELKFHQGVEALAAEDVIESVRLFRASIALNPQNPDPYYALGQTLALLGNPSEAQRCFAQALHVSPNHRRARAAAKALNCELVFQREVRELGVGMNYLTLPTS